MTLKWRYLGNVNWTHLFINISSNERSKALLLLNKDKSVIIPLDGILNFLNAVKGYEEMQKGGERERVHRYGVLSAASQDKFCLLRRSKLPDLRSGHTERGLPQRTAVSVRCEMLHSKQTLLTIIF